MVRKSWRLFGQLLTVAMAIELVGLGFLYYEYQAYPGYWQGRANEPGDFLYVALGDSTAQGLGASQPDKSYVSLIAQAIERQTGRRIRVVNLSRTGATLQDALREQVPQLPAYDPDLVTVEIGANNLRRYNDASFRQDYEHLVQALPPSRSVISEVPYFGGRRNYNRASIMANRAITELSKKYGIPHANLYETLRPRQSPWIYASDFLHPNDRGYRLWFEAFWPQIKAVTESKRASGHVFENR